MGGPDQGNSSYMYCIADEELDNMILEARKSLDQSYRKTLYKACLDTIVDWATEVPVYQRQNAIIFSTERVKMGDRAARYHHLLRLAERHPEHGAELSSVLITVSGRSC